MSEDKISSALGIRPIAEIHEDEIPENENFYGVKKQLPAKTKGKDKSTELAVVTAADQDNFENLRDIESVQSNIEEIMVTGAEAMKEMLEIAKQSEQPRAFEVVSTLMKTMLDANKEFADISTKKKFVKEELNGPKEAAQSGNNVTNNNLILSTTDLLKMLKGEDNGG